MLKSVGKTINLPPLFSENLPLVVCLLISIVLIKSISYKHGLVNALIFQCFKISSYEKLL